MGFNYIPVSGGIVVPGWRYSNQTYHIYRTQPTIVEGGGWVDESKTPDCRQEMPEELQIRGQWTRFFDTGDYFVPCQPGDRLWVVVSVTGAADGWGRSFVHIASFVVGDEEYRYPSDRNKGFFFVGPKLSK